MSQQQSSPLRSWHGEVLYDIYGEVLPLLSRYKIKELARIATDGVGNPVHEAAVSIEPPEDRLRFLLAITAPDQRSAVTAGITVVYEALTSVEIGRREELAGTTEFITMNLASDGELTMIRRAQPGVDDSTLLADYDVGDDARMILSQLEDFRSVLHSEAFNHL